MREQHAGAQRLPEWEFWFGVAFFIATLVLALYLAYGAKGLWQDRGALPVQQLLIHGERRYVSDAEVRQKLLVHGPLPSLTQLDVNWVRQQLKELHWVDEVAVRKEWPSQLHVQLVEYHPIARWKENQLVADDGRLFNVPDSSRVSELALIRAEDELVDDAVAMLAAVSQRTSAPELQVQELTISPRRAWRMKLVNQVELLLGREQRVARFERFLSLLPTLKEANNKLPLSVDLRYDTGAAVAWPEPEQQELTSQHGEK